MGSAELISENQTSSSEPARGGRGRLARSTSCTSPTTCSRSHRSAGPRAAPQTRRSCLSISPSSSFARFSSPSAPAPSIPTTAKMRLKGRSTAAVWRPRRSKPSRSLSCTRRSSCGKNVRSRNSLRRSRRTRDLGSSSRRIRPSDREWTYGKGFEMVQKVVAGMPNLRRLWMSGQYGASGYPCTGWDEFELSLLASTFLFHFSGAPHR